MPDLTDLLDRTTPRNLAPPDLDAIARIADQRRRRAPLMVGVAAVLAVVAGVVAIGVSGGDDDDAPQQVASAANPFGGDDLLTAPVGEWRRAADPPFGPRTPTLTGTLSDGRVLVWGNVRDDEDEPALDLDGGIYDPATDTWDAIDPAPLPERNVELRTVALAGDRLLVLGVTIARPTGTYLGAVYDVAARAWTELPQPFGVEVLAEGVAWTGDELAVVRTNPGGVGWSPDDDLDWRIDAPLTRRWRFGDDAWTDGAPPPLGLRSNIGVAFDGARLAIVGGTRTAVFQRETPGTGPFPDPGLVTDGAIYDVTADAWTAIPALPTTAVINPEATWLDGRLVVSASTDRFDMNSADLWPAVAQSYDPTTGTWGALPPAPEPPESTPVPTYHKDSYVVGVPVLLTARRYDDDSDPHPALLYTPTGWELAPLNDLRVVGPAIVATSAIGDNRDGDAFAVDLRTSAGTWLPAVDAPFSVSWPGIAAFAGDSLLVVGGDQGRDIEPQNDAWILDLNP